MSSLDAASHRPAATSPTRARPSGSNLLASTLPPTIPTAPHGRTTRPLSAMTAWRARRACSPTWRTTGKRLPPSTSSSWSSSSSFTPWGAARSGTTGRTTRTRPGSKVSLAMYRLLGCVSASRCYHVFSVWDYVSTVSSWCLLVCCSRTRMMCECF